MFSELPDHSTVGTPRASVVLLTDNDPPTRTNVVPQPISVGPNADVPVSKRSPVSHESPPSTDGMS